MELSMFSVFKSKTLKCKFINYINLENFKSRYLVSAEVISQGKTQNHSKHQTICFSFQKQINWEKKKDKEDQRRKFQHPTVQKLWQTGTINFEEHGEI